MLSVLFAFKGYKGIYLFEIKTFFSVPDVKYGDKNMPETAFCLNHAGNINGPNKIGIQGA